MQALSFQLFLEDAVLLTQVINDLRLFTIDPGTEGREEELKRERNLLLNAEKLSAVASEADTVLYSSEGAVLERLGRVINKLGESNKSSHH